MTNDKWSGDISIRHSHLRAPVYDLRFRRVLNLEHLAELLEKNRAAAAAPVKTFSIGGKQFDFNSTPAIMGVVNLVIVMVVFTILDHGRIISPAYGRLEAVRLARLRALSSRSPLATGVSR